MRRSARLSRNSPENEDTKPPNPVAAVPLARKPKRLALKDRPRPEYPYELIHKMPVTQHLPDPTELTTPLTFEQSKVLGYSVHSSRSAYLGGAMFETAWSRKPKDSQQANNFNRTYRLCDCVFIMGLHRFLGRLFTVKEEDGIPPQRQTYHRQPSGPPPSNAALIKRLQEMAKADPVLKELMATVASGKASPQLVAEFQKYIQKAKDLDPQPTSEAKETAKDKAAEKEPAKVKEPTEAKEPKEAANDSKEAKEAKTAEAKEPKERADDSKEANQSEEPSKEPPKEAQPSQPVQPTPTQEAQAAPTPPPEKPTFLAFEFNDNVSERFLFPRDSIVELLDNTDILISFLHIDEGLYTPFTITIKQVPPRIFPSFERCFETPAVVRKHMTEAMWKYERSPNQYVWYEVDKTDALLLDEIRKTHAPYFAVSQPKRQYKTRKLPQKYPTPSITRAVRHEPTGDGASTVPPAAPEPPRPKLNLPDINSIKFSGGPMPPLPKSLIGLVPPRPDGQN